MELSVGDLSLVIQQDDDFRVSFDARDVIDRDALHQALLIRISA
jgi:hypothetical protein